ncbi:MAG: DsbA family protein [Actinomycetota bacterium]
MEGEREIIYVGDPMCSWCWGIAPQLDELQRRLPGAGFRVITGGLRPGPNARQMDDDLAAHLEHEWTLIEQATGQPFDQSTIARRDFLYDTEPACRAVALMRLFEPTRAWPLFKRIQKAFYAEAVITTSLEMLAPLVREVGGDAGQMQAAFDSEEFRDAAWADFTVAREWGITSFPTVIARVGDQGHLLTIGYSNAEVMLERLPEGFGAETA